MIYFCVKFQKDLLYEVNLTFFCTLVTMATAAILNLFNGKKLPHTTVDIPTKFHEVWLKFVQTIPILLAYLVLLDVDVVPIKFH